MKLVDVRKRAKLTQAQLAEKAGDGQQTISRIETGYTQHPSHRTVMRICRALGVDPNEIDEFDDGVSDDSRPNDGAGD